jgi:putative membrane protein
VQETKAQEKAGMGHFLYRTLAGFLIGVSVLAPGISGSIIAIMMGIYQDILAMFSNPTKNIKRNALLVLPLAIGTVASMVAFVLVFSWLFTTYEKATYLFFVGLILGTIPVVYKEVKKHGWKIAGVVGMVASFAITFALSLAMTASNGTSVEAGTATYATPSMIEMAYGGFAMGASLLVPGMSASVILMLLGLYTNLLFIAEAIMHGELSLLFYIGVFAVCMFSGVILTARFIKKAFEKIPAIAYAIVLGFIGGSFSGIAVMSLQISDANFNWTMGVVSFVVGTALSLFFVYMNFKKEAKKLQDEAA